MLNYQRVCLTGRRAGEKEASAAGLAFQEGLQQRGGRVVLGQGFTASRKIQKGGKMMINHGIIYLGKL